MRLSKSAAPKAAPRRIFEGFWLYMQKSPPPSRAEEALDTSPPEGVEDKPAARATPILHPAKRGGGAERSEAEGGAEQKKSRTRRAAGTTERAKELRWRENSAEGLLWQELKGKKLGGHHFTRQLPIGPYFADFCCRKQKLVVEIDGSQHADNPYDRRRDEVMRSQGFSTLRFWNTDVLKHRTSVCETILAALEGRLAETVASFDLRFVYAGSSAGIALSETKSATVMTTAENRIRMGSLQ